MSQAAQAGERRPRRREVESWADDLDILGGLGEDKSADWTVLTLEREQPSSDGGVPPTVASEVRIERSEPGRARELAVAAAAPEVPPADHGRGREREHRDASTGRRTVVIRGQAAPLRAVVPNQRRRPAQRPRDRVGTNPDRIAMWAVGLGLLLILIAAMTAGG